MVDEEVCGVCCFCGPAAADGESWLCTAGGSVRGDADPEDEDEDEEEEEGRCGEGEGLRVNQPAMVEDVVSCLPALWEGGGVWPTAHTAQGERGITCQLLSYTWATRLALLVQR